MRPDIRAVTLDLDGTLLDTIPDLAAAINATRSELALHALMLDVVARAVGQGIADLVRRCLPERTDAERADDEALFRRHYAVCNGQRARRYPGVSEALERFAAHGLPLAVVTNKSACFTEPLLEALGMSHHFACIVSGDTTPHKKPHPAPLLHACARLGVAPAHTLHVGDSRHDFGAARAAGCAVALVSYGYHGGEDLAALDAECLADDLRSIADWAGPYGGHRSGGDHRL